VVAIESAGVDTKVKRDAALPERVLDERCLVNSSNGGARSKASVIADVRGGNLMSATIADRTVRVDGDTAIVLGTANFRSAVNARSMKPRLRGTRRRTSSGTGDGGRRCG